MKKILLFILIIILVGGIIASVSFFANNRPQATKEKTKIETVTSFYPMYFFASEIGGYKAQVQNLTPAGVEPHDYEPPAQDLANIERSNLLILNGAIEPWGDQLAANLKDSNVQVVFTGDGLMNNQFTDEEGNTAQDPHTWLDPILAKEQAKKIAQAFINVDPKNQTYYENNLAILNEKLDALHKSYQDGLRNCQTTNVVTSHAAFGYLTSRYGLTQIPISGLSPEAEPSLQEIADVADFANENNVNYIFFETLVSPELAQTVADEIGAQTLVLDPLEGLSEADIQQGKNYFTVMDENLKNLQTALQCR